MSTKNQPDPQPSPSRPQPSAARDQATRPTEVPKSVQPQRPVQPQIVQRPRSLPPDHARAAAASTGEVKKDRLFSLDAYRGFVMVVLAAAGFGILQVCATAGRRTGVAVPRLRPGSSGSDSISSTRCGRATLTGLACRSGTCSSRRSCSLSVWPCRFRMRAARRPARARWSSGRSTRCSARWC